MSTEVLVAFLSSIPVWGILLFFFYRNIKGRDQFEKDVLVELDNIHKILSNLDKALALLANDMEHAADLEKTVAAIDERVTKVRYDVELLAKKAKDAFPFIGANIG